MTETLEILRHIAYIAAITCGLVLLLVIIEFIKATASKDQEPQQED